MIPHLGQSDIVTASYSTLRHFLGIFGGQNGPQGGLRGRLKNNFWQEDVIYLDNSNDTSFRSIGHRNSKVIQLFNIFWAFLVILGGQNGPQGGLRGVGENFFDEKMCFT